jgi:hypothetical protein
VTGRPDGEQSRARAVLDGAEGDDQLTFYNPAGTVARLAAPEVRGGRLGPLGFPHLQAVVLPAG